MRDNINVIKDVQGDSLTCLKLEKRQHFGDSANPAKVINLVTGNSAGDCVYKKPRALSASTAQPPRCRCQVEGWQMQKNITRDIKSVKCIPKPSKSLFLVPSNASISSVAGN